MEGREREILPEAAATDNAACNDEWLHRVLFGLLSFLANGVLFGLFSFLANWMLHCTDALNASAIGCERLSRGGGVRSARFN